MKIEKLGSGASKYKVILADPPWTFSSWSRKGEVKSAQNHYSCMSLEELIGLPVFWTGDRDCILFMWATSPMIDEQIKVMERWGFEYKTIGFTWIKLNPKALTPFIGLGYYTRSNAEYCLIGTRGKPGRPKNKGISSVIMSPIREHSRKPDIVRQYIMNMYDGPYLELFAREETDGWDYFGNETQKFNSLF